MSRTKIALPIEELVARYQAGDSTPALGHAYAVSPQTITHRLVAAGVKMRPRGAPPGNRYGLGNKSRLGHYKRGGPLYIVSGGYLGTIDRTARHRLIHRACWEAYHGPIPDGHIVHHIDQDRLNNLIKNLACMTQGEHTRLHRTL